MYHKISKSTKYTKEGLEAAAKKVKSWSGLIRSFGLKNTGGNYAAFQDRIRFFGINVDHFRGQGWSSGETKYSHTSVAQIAKTRRKYTDDDLLIRDAPYWVSGTKLKPMLLRKGISYECKGCRTITWLGKPLSLHVDHINGVHNDNRVENLRFLCPNCHQQTDTWGIKNMKIGAREGTRTPTSKGPPLLKR